LPSSKAENSAGSAIKPRGLYYGYVIAGVSFVLMMFGWGIFYIYGVFFNPLESEFHWTRAVTSGAFSLSVLVSGVVGIIAGRLSDRLGPKIVLMFCAVFLAAGYGLMSTVHDVWQFYLIYGLLIATGVGGFSGRRWFRQRRAGSAGGGG
jgi:MFS family permease